MTFWRSGLFNKGSMGGMLLSRQQHKRPDAKDTHFLPPIRFQQAIPVSQLAETDQSATLEATES